MKFSYLVQLILQQIKKKIFAYSILTVQVFGSALLMVIVITMIRYFGNTYQTLNRFENKEVLIVSPEKSNGNVFESGTKLLAESKALRGVKTEQTVWSALYSEKNISSSINTLVYGEIMAENVVLNLEKGVQLKDSAVKDGAYPIIVNSESPYVSLYKIGEVFKLYYDNGERFSGAITEDSFGSIAVYICGILKSPDLVYQIENSNTVIIENLLYEPNIKVAEEIPFTFLVMRDVQFAKGGALSENVKLNTGNKPFIMEITSDNGSVEYEEIQQWISENGVAVSIQALLDRGFANYNEGTANFVIILIVFSLLTIMGLSGINLFLADSLKNEYSLYFMCGAEWSTCVLLEALRSLFVVFIPATLGSLVGLIYVLSDRAKDFADVYLILYVTLFILFIYLISTLYFLIKLGKTRPIENIRLMVKE